MNIKKLQKLHTEAEEFLLEYASGIYGKAKYYNITKTVVKKFLAKADEWELEETISYKSFKKDMLKALGTEYEGAEDLEMHIKHVVTKGKEDQE